MKKSTWLLLLNILFIVLPAYSQSYLISDKTFGTSLQEWYPQMASKGNHLVIAGSTFQSGIEFDKTDSSCSQIIGQSKDTWVVKCDLNYSKIFDYSFGGSNIESTVGNVEINADGNIYIIGTSNSDSSCNKSENSRGGYDLWLIALDSTGNLLWERTYGSSGNERPADFIQLSSGEFIIAGTSNGPIDGDKSSGNIGGYDIWLIKTDNVGNKIWDKSLGGVNDENSIGTGGSIGMDLLLLDSNKFILMCSSKSSNSGNVTDTTNGLLDELVMAMDSSGTILWDKLLGGSQQDYPNSVCKSKNGFLICGFTTSPISGDVSEVSRGNQDVWVIEIDSVGNKLWDKRYGGSGYDYGTKILPSPDGGYWISAVSQSPQGFELSEPSYGGADYWMLKIDSIGNILWEKRFGAQGFDYPMNFVIMPDSSIFVAGFGGQGASAVKTDAGKGFADYWIVHFNYYQNTSDIHEQNAQLELTLWPMPTQDAVNVKGLPIGSFTANIYSIEGRLLHTENLQGGAPLSISLTGLSSGMYLLEFKNDSLRATVKVLKN